MLPHADYERITRAIKAILDSENAATAHSCQFFALIGSAILFTHYQIPATPMFGAAFVLLDETSRDILTYGRLDGDDADSDPDHYHAWVDAGEFVIDFMAPLYGDAMRTKGYMKDVPRWMMQRPKSTLADHHHELQRQGDCHLLANPALSQYMVQYFLKEPMYRDLIEITTRWYRKPPEAMMPFQTQSASGKVRHVSLDQLSVTGSWTWSKWAA